MLDMNDEREQRPNNDTLTYALCDEICQGKCLHRGRSRRGLLRGKKWVLWIDMVNNNPPFSSS